MEALNGVNRGGIPWCSRKPISRLEICLGSEVFSGTLILFLFCFFEVQFVLFASCDVFPGMDLSAA